jgi:serine/threonine protein kinase
MNRSLFASKVQLQSEIQILRSFPPHGNIVRICGSGNDYIGGGPFLLLEYLPNGTWSDRLATALPRVRGFSAFFSSASSSLVTTRFITALHLTTQLASALGFLHKHALKHLQQSILHLALTPEHLGFATDGSLRLLGFGAASVATYGSAVKKAPVSDPAVLRYASPEALTGTPCTTAADVFAFSALSWCILSHAVPHAAVPDAHVAAIVCGGARAPLNPHWSSELRMLMAQGWATRPESRYATTSGSDLYYCHLFYYSSAVLAALANCSIADYMTWCSSTIAMLVPRRSLIRRVNAIARASIAQLTPSTW